MLIYHKEKNIVKCIEIIYGINCTNIKKSNYIWEKHKPMVEKLENNGDIFVTGATFVGMDYSGTFVKRELFKKYLEI